MTRRELLMAAAAARSLSASLPGSSLAVAGYIFQQDALRQKKTLREVSKQAFSMARGAGFKNIELGSAFFAPEMRDEVLAQIRLVGLRMPSLYVGGSLHEKRQAEETIAAAVNMGTLGAPFGCQAIVNNPDPKPGNVRKTDVELSIQADALNRMGRILARNRLQLRVHHHTPQLDENAREWRHILQNTDAAYVHLCVDVDWAYESGFEPIPFLEMAGDRLREIHVRSARNKLWLEDVEDSDIDYHQVAAYLKKNRLAPLIVVELAYRPATVVTRSLQQDLALSRLYAGKIFDLKGEA